MKKAISIFTALTVTLWLSGIFMVLPVHAAFADGDLVREADEFDVYIVKLVGDKKFSRLILNPDVFNMYGHLKWENIQVVADGTLADYTISELVRADGDEKVYKLYPDGDVGTKKWVESLDCFTSQGFDWDSVYVINSFDRDSYTTSSTALCGGEEVVAGDITLSLASDSSGAATLSPNNYGVSFMKVSVAGSGTISQVTLKRSGAGDVGDFDNVYIYQNGTRLTSGRSISSSTSKVTFINLSLAAPTTFEIVADLSATTGNVNYFEILSAADVTSDAAVGGAFPIAGNPMAISGTNAGTLTVARSGASARNATIGEVEAEISRFKVTTATEGTNLERIQLFNSGTVTNTLITDLKLKDVSGKVVATADQIGDDGYVTFVFDSPFYIKKGGNEVFYVYAKIGGVKPDRTITLYLELATDILGKGTTYGYGMQATITSYDSDTLVTVTCKGGDLTLSKIGPNAANIGTDTDDTVLLEFSMTSAADITIKRTRLFLCIDAGGDGTWDTTSSSADYEDMKIKEKDTGTILVGPKDGSSINDGSVDAGCATAIAAEYEDFTDTFDMVAGETKTLQLTVDIKVANTDAGTVIAADAKIKVGLFSYATLVGTSGNVSYMKYTGTTDAVDDSAIAPSGNIVGETMTVKSSSLTLSLAATPSGASTTSDSKTFIIGQGDVEAVGIIFTAGAASDVDVSAITLTGYMTGTAAGSYATAAKWLSGQDGVYVKDTISKVYIYDSTTGALVPGSVGKGFSGTTYELVEYTGLSWTIPAGESRTLLVKADISSASTASGSSADLFFAFDIEAAADVTSTDKDGNTITATGNTANGGNATDASVAPNTDFGIAQRGALAIAAASDTPERKLLVMGTSDNEVSKFKLTGTNEGWYIEKFSPVLYDGAAESLDDLDNFTGLKLKYQTEAQYNSSDWTISSPLTFGATASRAFTFSGSARPYVPKDDDSYISVLVDVKGYLGGTGGKSKVPVRIGYTDGSADSFKAYGAQSGYYSNVLTAITATDYYLHFIARSKPVFAKKAWGGGETELARFTVTAEGGDVIFKNTDFDMSGSDGGNYGGSQPVSALLAFDVIASGTSAASTSFYLYDWTNTVISSAEGVGVYNPITDYDAESNYASIGFHFEEGNKTVTIPAGETKEFHIDIGGGDLTDFDNTDEYIYLKLKNDSGDDFATGTPGLKEMIYDDNTNEEGIGGSDASNDGGNPDERYMMPQNVMNIGSLPLIFRTLRGTTAP